jgi:adenine-specific DNA-methyltransferase
MYPRLKLLHRLLADDGAIFISIDEVEQANLKILCDEIFGLKNFIGIYNWFKSATPPNLSHKIKKNIEYVLSYSKTSNSDKFFGIQKISKSDDPIIKPQNTLKELIFPIGSINTKIEKAKYPKGIYGTEKYPNQLLNELIIENYTNANEVSFKNKFIWVQEKLNEELANNTRININSKSLVISYKKSNYDNEVPPNLINESVGVTTTENAGRLLLNIFGEKIFDYPKPPSLIEYIINFLCDKNTIILDSFAGSGTTAHAVLNLNKEDGGNRKFILVEMEDYADTITAERVRRVIKGYGKGTKAVEGTGGDFTYYELGEAMFIEKEFLNENLPLEEIRKYVYYTETGSTKTYQAQSEVVHIDYLGHHHNTDYYFHYEKGALTYLDTAFLNTITQKADGYVIYADVCALSDDFMRTHNIVFKKIPRDITRL